MPIADNSQAKRYLKPIHLKGGGVLPNGVLPAPMEGVLSPAFCHALMQESQVGAWITPFIRISVSVPRRTRLIKAIDYFLETKLPLIVQLMGRDPDRLCETAKRFAEVEAVKGINFNFACPSKTVLSSGAGGALLSEPKLMEKIVQKSQQALPHLSISAKIRTGRSHAHEMEEIIPRLCAAGLDLLMIHHRTVNEEYQPCSQRKERLIKACALSAPLPVLLSGDIFNYSDVLECASIPYSTGLMAARGLIKNPFIISNIIESLNQGCEINSSDREKINFFATMLSFCLKDPQKYWSHRYYLEMCRRIFGQEHPIYDDLMSIIIKSRSPKIVMSFLEQKL
ncbi:MAG: tRNA-dihydrouridine synthase family protein [Planctomycetes bacterium]|nr:tRNA-dihydrouridine synthase family protein [Planctomycetota bacterium]